ncbi:hypothetical protein I302_102349 [Kwoniella bestiolae CBS 10118]|uniref:U3 small nucleolar RNA-associated protein 13 n=1 Tax=Kwoniella bestiolae CBS 10118 TaxID=1296100 RepID=A0A1B9GEV3_9TREE|nr:U3 small nucleolar RNA-associated protein 13 [Kwoniella bestiolae CBS 10118]OCF29535.1 U3 small nucleolar RNA-associated protein 13 [Kwoniella bestiolae CBS 10118]
MNGQPSRKALKTSFRASPRSIRPIYTGGPVLLTKDGQWLITTMGEEVLVTEVKTGLAIAKIRGDSTPITSLALSYHTEPPTLITAHSSMTIRYYPLPSSAPSTSTPKPPLLSYTRALSKAYSAPILISAVSPDSTLLATGSSDGIVKVWDLEGGYVTHLFRGHGGPVSALHFNFPNIEGEERRRMELITGSTDARVRIFDLRDASARVVGGGNAVKPKAVLEGHVSVVRGIDTTSDGKWAVTGGRDKVVLVWDMLSGETVGSSKKAGKGKATAIGTPKIVQTIIAQEQIESLGLLPSEESVAGSSTSRLLCYTGGDTGSVKIWDVLKGAEVGAMKGVEGVDEAEVDEDEQRGVLDVIYDSTTSSLVSIHADQNIIFHSLSSLQAVRQIVGFNDEIVDTTFLNSSSSSSHTHLALATNSNLIRLYSTSTFDVRLLSGHKDMVLCLDKSADNQWLVSGSKDRTARVWAPTPDGKGWKCIAICEGHAESIGAVAISRKMDDKGKSGRFLFTASQDRTIKMWDLTSLPLDPASFPDEPIKPRSMVTLKVHEKDINSLDLSPNDKFLASGSQDKLVKIFHVDFDASSGSAAGSLKLAGSCKGHRRGVWSVKFSRTDRVVASAANDKTVRLWSLDDFSCLKTFEGHTNAVLRVDFLSHGMQLITSARDGLVKLWNIKDEECVKTLDNHEDQVWALAISSDEKTIVSAGSDSVATFWEDSTEVEQAEKNDALVKAVQSEQDFTNYIVLKDYRRAILLALSMSQPGRLLNLFRTIITSPEPAEGSIIGSLEVDEVLQTLHGIDLVRLLKFVRDWNANAKTSPIAQTILYAIFKLRSPEDILQAFNSSNRPTNPVDEDGEEEIEEEGEEKKKKVLTKDEKLALPISIQELLDGLIPYSERHFARVDKLVQDSYMLDYVLGEMDGGLFGGEIMDVDE